MKYYFRLSSIEYIIDFNDKNQIEITIDRGFGPGVSFCLVRSLNDARIDWELNKDEQLPYKIPEELKRFINGIIRLSAFT